MCPGGPDWASQGPRIANFQNNPYVIYLESGRKIINSATGRIGSGTQPSTTPHPILPLKFIFYLCKRERSLQREHISCFAKRNGIFLSALRASPERPGASRSRKMRNFSSGASRDWSAAITPLVTRLVHFSLSAQLKNGHLRLRRIARLTRWHYAFMAKVPRVSLRHFVEPKMNRSFRALRHFTAGATLLFKCE